MTTIVEDRQNLEPRFGSRWKQVIAAVLGDNFLAYLTLAIGAALVFGNGLALLRPRIDESDGQLVRAPLGRSLIQITVGGIASIWALATILA